MEKSKSWYKKYKLRGTPKSSKGHRFLCDLPVGSVFGISSIGYKGYLLQVSTGGCWVLHKDSPKYTKMGEIIGKADKREYIGRRTEVDVWGETINTDRFIKRRKTISDNTSDSIGARKDKRLIRMATKRGKKRGKK